MCVIGNGMWGMCYTDLGIALGTLCALELKAEDLGIALGTLCALELKAEGNNASINHYVHHVIQLNSKGKG